ncbi:hypothetical protein GPECTOR_38g310 [Gonium pectorale]|uniref:Kri1-like C-terminal domain-containing protein n=1 Tax=Gonium pectorale TaxID=33097 RepID=A0A150GBB9_GONPE|nr:hypothetical protein GPECTOR_38g310 [Gonium pectorale]|eukprot:KXZ47073.1 hypothetical protein GPECTOR_38g310 [Gonium pectorale]
MPPPAKQKKQSLLDEEGDAGEGGGADLAIRVNKAYAARFEHNKRREELHRLQSKYPEEAEKLARKIAREAAKAAGEELPPRDENDDDSSSEEEDDGEIPIDTEAKIFETLLRIRRQDPAIYQKDVQFFEEGDEEDGEGDDGGQKKDSKKKPMFLKDLIAKQASSLVLEHGPEASNSDDDDESGGRKASAKARNPKVYDVEQEDLRKAFLQAAEVADGEGGEAELGGVLKVRSKQQPSDDGDEDGKEGADGGRKKSKKGVKKESETQFQKLIEAYFGTEGELNPDDKFLKEYIVSKGWVDRDDDYVPSYREVVGDEDEGGQQGTEGVDDDEDEAYLRQTDVFEATYNFRYEEPGADRIVTHPRNIEGTVRKPEEKRKRQRDAKKQRLEAAENEAREDVKRLKNLKKQEIESRLDKLRQVAGAAAPASTSLDDVLEGDFDPEEWDKKMAAAFDDAYYDVEEELEGLQEDLDLLAGDGEDDGDGDDGEDSSGDEEGRPVRFNTLKKKLKELDAVSEEPEEEGGEGKKGKKGKARPDAEALARQRAELQRLLEEYYKLDYEDNVGGIKTRFRYKEVPASTFGLDVADILRLDDKMLNQVVGIKRLAPYRTDLEKQRPNYKALEMIKGDLANFKKERRQYKKREWEKGQGWHGKAGQRNAAQGEPNGAAAQDGEQRQRKRKDHDRRERPAGGDADGEAGPGPGSDATAAEAAKGGDRPKKRKERPDSDAADGEKQPARKPGREQHKPKHERQPVDPQQARLASYAVPTLKKESGGWQEGSKAGGKKRKHGEEGGQGGQKGEAKASDGPQLTRAQKKNMKRSQKRAEKRVPTATAG